MGVFRPGTDRVIGGAPKDFEVKGRRALFAPTDRSLTTSLRKFCNGQLQFAYAAPNVGYLRILAFGDYAKHGDNRRALDAALDRIFSDRALRGLIVDVRLSFGGDDKLGLALASRLTAAEYLAYSIEARAHPTNADSWSPADPVYIRPSARPSFHGPVVELIGSITMIAAETFTQALQGRTPHVTTIGENTQGLFCDSLGRRLPNGWIFSLPNAVYRTAAGEAFDVRGTPPEIEIPLFTPADLSAARDPALAKALEILTSSNHR